MIEPTIDAFFHFFMMFSFYDCLDAGLLDAARRGRRRCFCASRYLIACHALVASRCPPLIFACHYCRTIYIALMPSLITDAIDAISLMLIRALLSSRRFLIISPFHCYAMLMPRYIIAAAIDYAMPLRRRRLHAFTDYIFFFSCAVYLLELR